MPHATETLNSSTGGALSLPIPIPSSISNSLYNRNITSTLVTEPSVSSHNSYSDYVHNSVTCSADDNSSTVHDQDLYVGCSSDGASFISPSSDSNLRTFEVNHCRDNLCCNMDHRNLHDLLQHVDTNHPRLKVVDGAIYPFETSTVYTQYNGFPTFNASPIGFVHSVVNSSPHSPQNESKPNINMSDDNFHAYINDIPPSVMGKQKWGSHNLGQGNGSQDDKSCESDTDLHLTWLYENKNALNPSNFSVSESTYIRDHTSSNSSSISTSYNSSPHAFQMNADQDPLLSAVQSPLMSYPPTPVDATDSSTFLRSATSSPTNLGDFSAFISILDNQSSILTSSPPPSSTTVPTNTNNNRQQNSSIITKSNDTKTSLNNYTSFNIPDFTPYVSRLNGHVRSQTTPPSSITNSQSGQCRRRSSTTNINSNGSDTNSSQQNSYASRSSPNINGDKSNNKSTISNQRRASSSLEDSNLLVHQQSSFMSIGSDPDFSQPGTSTIVVTRDQHRQLPSSPTVDPNLLVEMNDFMSTSTNYLQGNATSPIGSLPRPSSDSKNYMIVQNNSSTNNARSPCASGSLPPVTTSPYSADSYHMVGFVSSGLTNSGLVSSFVKIRPKTSNGMVAMSDVYADPALTSPDGFSQGKKFSKKRTISADTRTCKRRSLETSNISSVTVLTSDVSLITETNGGLSSDDVDNHPYRCPVPDCTKAYKNANGLKYHNEHGHTSNDGARQKPWPCRVENCHKAYGSKGGLIYHVNRNHPNDLWALP
ncbi:10242_t:CDS:2 [Dentiscutata erythropus]|uniref:10242_t:CDS:1 n=1 Tax=Dentiscutata erythropus TaxID=1348616 RepID=A0A9N9F2T3_9GLOM|nr:10242_t:CDS:2 [Dentiscutata erythropus]